MIDITTLNLTQKLALSSVIEQSRMSIASGSAEIMKLTGLLDNFMSTQKIESDVNGYLFQLDKDLLDLQLKIKQEIEKKIGEAQLAYLLQYNYVSLPNVLTNQALAADSDAKDYIISILDKNIDHRYAALMIDDVCTEFFNAMVSADPFYILTSDVGEQKILDNLGSNVSKSFIRYPIAQNGRFIPTKLPRGQLNLILSTQLFSLASLNSLPSTLQKLLALLRPGGRFICSFIDAETEGGVNMLDSWDFQNKQGILKPSINFLTRSYLENRIFKPIEGRTDTKIESSRSFDSHSVYVFRKTGNLKTVKNKKTIRLLKAV